MRHRACTFAAILCLTSVNVCSAADDDEEDILPQHGLYATYRSGGHEFHRIDTHIALDLENELADSRLSTGLFSITWTGQILIPSDGNYVFYTQSIGEVEFVAVGENSVMSDQSDGWSESKQISLKAGLNSIRVRFRGDSSRARMVLYWSGPNFRREPIAPRWLVPSTVTPRAAEYDQYVRGWELINALQCAACHTLPGYSDSLMSSPMASFAGNVSPAWMLDWIAGKLPAGSTSHRMPDFDLEVNQARAITAHLLGTDNDPVLEDDEPAGDNELGKRLFLTIGCLSCHRLGALGSSDILDGGDLSNVGHKRPAWFFSAWLTNPDRIHKAHRMPVFELSKPEVANLAAYLSSLRTTEMPTPELRNADVAQGQRLVTELGCANCHASTRHSVRAKTPLLAEKDYQTDNCLGKPARSRPGYELSEADQAAILGSWKHPPHRISETRKHLCLNCHSRDGSQGNTLIANAVFETHPDIVPHVAALSPPTLTSIGDKLTGEALARAISGEADRIRPWLEIRMPRPSLSHDERTSLHRQLTAQDQIPFYIGAPTARSRLKDTALHPAGAMLVTSEGFGCASCHDIGKHTPKKSPLNARGPQLVSVQRRIRPEWFHRWLTDPLRIHPRVEMPAIRVPVSGILDSVLDDQIAAVWSVLQDKNFTPGPIEAVRVVRFRPEGITSRANILTDGILVNADETLLKPFLIGLSNRHNVLFDLAKGRLAGWWIGDTARQYNDGKVWSWRSGREDLLTTELPETDFSLVRIEDGKEFLPARIGQFRTTLDGWHRADDSVIFDQRLRFMLPGLEQPVSIKLSQHIAPVAANPNRWHRLVKCAHVPDGYQLHWDFRSVRSNVASALPDVGISNERRGTLVLQRHGQGIPREHANSNPVGTVDDRSQIASVTYEATTPIADINTAELPTDKPPSETITSVPGFAGIKLSLPEEIMPIALAWRPGEEAQGHVASERLVVCDMKGRVWLATDSNKDGLLNSIAQFGDEFATPYGAYATQQYVDIITKHAVVRLWDKNADGVVERTDTLVDGWGHTDDYHDWAVGLPRTQNGAYLVALPCQQDERSAAAAALRGRVLRLVPRETTDDNPHRFRIEAISAGHRFAMGIAQNRAGEIFVTDNQGNYNPFNELNHVLPGKHFGFINRLEKTADSSPKLTPPAVDLPHPWTRSVNGIAFLETPDKLVAAGQKKHFGPFEGHLIGCEYDTRRLIRISLDHVGKTIQGAAYPLSYEDETHTTQLTGPITAMIAPSGDIYVGNIRDAGWGGGGNKGNIVRLRLQPDALPAGIAEVTAELRGLRIKFTRTMNRSRLSDASRYEVSSFTRVSTPQYGGDDKDRRSEVITRVVASDDASSALVELPQWRAGYVYEIRLQNMTADDAEFFPGYAFYTLRTAPQ